MEKLRAKFKVVQIVRDVALREGGIVKLEGVYSPDPAQSNYTDVAPRAVLELATTRGDVMGHLALGTYFVLEFTPVDD